MAKGLWPVLNVSSVDKSSEFYKALGLKVSTEEQPGMGRWATITVSPESGLVLWPKDVIGTDQPEDTRAWVSGELGKGVMLTLGIANARKTWEKATAQRFRVDAPLAEQPWGGAGFTLVDPDGYVVNFTDRFPGAPPKKKSTARGAKAKRAGAKKKPAGKKRR